jgi:hypothetical protein
MAWIVGLASPEEIAAILKAGYEIHTHNVMPEIGYFAMPEGNEQGIAVFVDCDVQDLLDMKGE